MIWMPTEDDVKYNNGARLAWAAAAFSAVSPAVCGCAQTFQSFCVVALLVGTCTGGASELDW